jgi:hypothetical protein
MFVNTPNWAQLLSTRPAYSSTVPQIRLATTGCGGFRTSPLCLIICPVFSPTGPLSPIERRFHLFRSRDSRDLKYSLYREIIKHFTSFSFGTDKFLVPII